MSWLEGYQPEYKQRDSTYFATPSTLSTSAGSRSEGDAYLTELYLHRYGFSDSAPPQRPPNFHYESQENRTSLRERCNTTEFLEKRLEHQGDYELAQTVTVDGNKPELTKQAWCPSFTDDHSNNQGLPDVDSNVPFEESKVNFESCKGGLRESSSNKPNSVIHRQDFHKHLENSLKFSLGDKTNRFSLNRETNGFESKLTSTWRHRNRRCRESFDNSYRYTSPRTGMPCARSPLHLWRYSTPDKYTTLYPFHCKYREATDRKPTPSTPWRNFYTNTTDVSENTSESSDSPTRSPSQDDTTDLNASKFIQRNYRPKLPSRPKSCDNYPRSNHTKESMLINSTSRNYRPGVGRLSRQAKFDLRPSVHRFQNRPSSATAKFAGGAYIDSNFDHFKTNGAAFEMSTKYQQNLRPRRCVDRLDSSVSTAKDTRGSPSRTAPACYYPSRLKCHPKYSKEKPKIDSTGSETSRSFLNRMVRTREGKPLSEKRGVTAKECINFSSKNTQIKNKKPNSKQTLVSSSNDPRTCENGVASEDCQRFSKLFKRLSIPSHKPSSRRKGELASPSVQKTKTQTINVIVPSQMCNEADEPDDEPYNAYNEPLILGVKRSNNQCTDEVFPKCLPRRELRNYKTTNCAYNVQKIMTLLSLKRACGWGNYKHFRPNICFNVETGTVSNKTYTATSKNQPAKRERRTGAPTKTEHIGGSNYEVKMIDAQNSKISRFKVTSKDRPSLDWTWNKNSDKTQEKRDVKERVNDHWHQSKRKGSVKTVRFENEMPKDTKTVFKKIHPPKTYKKINVGATETNKEDVRNGKHVNPMQKGKHAKLMQKQGQGTLSEEDIINEVYECNTCLDYGDCCPIGLSSHRVEDCKVTPKAQEETRSTPRSFSATTGMRSKEEQGFHPPSQPVTHWNRQEPTIRRQVSCHNPSTFCRQGTFSNPPPTFRRQVSFHNPSTLSSASLNDGHRCEQASIKCRSAPCTAVSWRHRPENDKAQEQNSTEPCSFLSSKAGDTQASVHALRKNLVERSPRDKTEKSRKGDNHVKPDTASKGSPKVPHDSKDQEGGPVSKKSSAKDKDGVLEKKKSVSTKRKKVSSWHFGDKGSTGRKSSKTIGKKSGIKSKGPHVAKSGKAGKRVRNKTDAKNKDLPKENKAATRKESQMASGYDNDNAEDDELNRTDSTPSKEGLKMVTMASSEEDSVNTTPSTKPKGEPGSYEATVAKTVRDSLNKALLSSMSTDDVAADTKESEVTNEGDLEYTRSSCVLNFSSVHEARTHEGSSVDGQHNKPINFVASLTPSASLTGKTQEGTDLDEFYGTKVKHVTITDLNPAETGSDPGGTDLDSFYRRRISKVTIVAPTTAITGPTVGGSSVDELQGRGVSNLTTLQRGEKFTTEGSDADGFSYRRSSATLANGRDREAGATTASLGKSMVGDDDDDAADAEGVTRILSGFLWGLNKLVSTVGDLTIGNQGDLKDDEMKTRSSDLSLDPAEDATKTPALESPRPSHIPLHHVNVEESHSSNLESHKSRSPRTLYMFGTSRTGPPSIDSALSNIELSRTVQADLFIPIKLLLRKLAERRSSPSSDSSRPILSRPPKFKSTKTKQLAKSEKNNVTKEARLATSERTKTPKEGQSELEKDSKNIFTGSAKTVKYGDALDKNRIGETTTRMSMPLETYIEDKKKLEARTASFFDDKQPQVIRTHNGEKLDKDISKTKIPVSKKSFSRRVSSYSSSFSLKPRKVIYACPTTVKIDLNQSTKKTTQSSTHDVALLKARQQRSLAETYSSRIYDETLPEAVMTLLKKQAMRNPLKQRKISL